MGRVIGQACRDQGQSILDLDRRLHGPRDVLHQAQLAGAMAQGQRWPSAVAGGEGIVFLGQPGGVQVLLQQVHEERIETLSGSGTDRLKCLHVTAGARASGAVYQVVVGVGHGEDPRPGRNHLAAEAIREPRAVPALSEVPDGIGHRIGERDRLDQLGGESRMDIDPLCRQFQGGVGVTGDTEPAQLVNESRGGKCFELRGRESQSFADAAGESFDASLVGPDRRILHGAGVVQTARHGAVDPVTSWCERERRPGNPSPRQSDSAAETDRAAGDQQEPPADLRDSVGSGDAPGGDAPETDRERPEACELAPAARDPRGIMGTAGHRAELCVDHRENQAVDCDRRDRVGGSRYDPPCTAHGRGQGRLGSPRTPRGAPRAPSHGRPALR